MSEQITTPWQGDWQRRLHEKLESFGYGSLEEYLQSHRGVGYVKIAESLGDANIAAMQLYGEHIRTAATEGRLRQAAADSLSRFLVEHIKRGWQRGRHFDLRLASAFGDWKTVLRQFSVLDEKRNRRLDAITEAIKASNPPEGWIPDSGDDPILRNAFEGSWPE